MLLLMYPLPPPSFVSKNDLNIFVVTFYFADEKVGKYEELVGMGKEDA
jgi:hypothetical protein